MIFVKVTVDGVTYYLSKQSDGTWVVTNRAPLVAGDYFMTVTLVTEFGQEITLDTTDPELLKAVTLLVREGKTISGKRMLDYYPEVVKILQEIQAITHTEGFEIDFVKSEITIVLNNAWLLTMDESRIAEWETILQLPRQLNTSLDDRRERIIATIRGKGKLNTALINNIVGTFTNGGGAKSHIENGVLYVRISPPIDNKQYNFTNVEEALKKLVPAHLGLVVSRNYSTWGDIKNNFASWDSISKLDTWEDLISYTPPS